MDRVRCTARHAGSRRAERLLSHDNSRSCGADATGTVRWRATTGEQGAKTSGSSIVLSGSFLVAGDYNVVAFEPDTGAVRWRFVPVEGFAPGLFLGATAQEVVYTGSPAGRLYAIDSQSGVLRWSTQIPTDRPTTVFEPVVDAEIVVAAYTTFTSPPTGGVLALDAGSGAVRWRAPFPDSEVPMQSTGAGGGPVIAGPVIVAASGTGGSARSDQATGSIQWSLPSDDTPGCCQSIRRGFGAAHSGSALVAASLTGRITAYDLRSRKQLWRTRGSARLRRTSHLESDGGLGISRCV